MGHLEAGAAAASCGYSKSIRFTSLVPPLAQLRRLNTHVASFFSSGESCVNFLVEGRYYAQSPARLSSFGFSGTIAHCLLVPYRPPPTRLTVSVALSLFRRAVDAPVEIRVFPARRRDDATATTLLTVVRVSGTIRDHLINGTVIFPGVGYLEIAA